MLKKNVRNSRVNAGDFAPAPTEDQGEETPPPAYDGAPPPAYDGPAAGDGDIDNDSFGESSTPATEKLLEDELDMEAYDHSSKKLNTEEGMDMKTAVLKWFALLGAAIMICLYGALSMTVVFTNLSMIEQTKSELISQVDLQAYTTLDEAGGYLTRTLSQYDEAVISYTSFGLNNALRNNPDFAQSKSVTNYWDDDTGLSALCQPTAYDPPRFPGEKISKCASSAFLTDTNAAGWQSVSGNTLDIVNKTKVMDTFLMHMYENYEDVYIIYAGFATTPSFTRRYPGRATQKLYAAGNYDPTVRPWYKDAEADSGGATIYTAPYQDYHTQAWMITGARVIYNYLPMSGYYEDSTGPSDSLNPDTYGTVTGVVGADLLIETLSEHLGNIKFLESGKLSLIRSTGQVVADNDWDIATATKAFYYSDLTTPSVSDALWTKIYLTPAGETNTISYEDNGDERKAFVKHLSVYNGQFYVVVFILEEEIYSTVAEAIAQLESINAEVCIILAIGLSCMFALLIFLMILLIRAIMKIFQEIEGNVEQLLRNVGQSDKRLGDNMVVIDSGASSELTQLSQSMNQMVHNLQANRGLQSVEVTKEGGGQITLDQMWNLVPMGDTAPNAPKALNMLPEAAEIVIEPVTATAIADDGEANPASVVTAVPSAPQVGTRFDD